MDILRFGIGTSFACWQAKCYCLVKCPASIKPVAYDLRMRLAWRLAAQKLAIFVRNPWPFWTGIRGHFPPETMAIFARNTQVHINRLKNGDPSVHFLEGNEIRALRKLRRDYPSNDFVFLSERQGPLSINAVHKIVARAGVEAGLEISAHPHMLRHAKGFQLADRGIDTRAIQGYLGHKNIQHTVKYTQLNAERFKSFGKDANF